MTSAPAFTEPSRKVVDAAIGWLVQLNHGTPDAAARSAFQQWLLQHPTHAEAWRRISGLDADLARLAGDTSAGLPASMGRPLRAGLTRHTLGMAADARQQRKQQRDRASRRQALKTLCWAGTGAAALWLGHREAPWQRLVADISTGIGERRDMHLPDGTMLALNTDTAMKLDFAQAAPRLTLLRGECMVQSPANTAASLAGDQTRLRLATPHGEVQAMQARFVARLMPDAVQLSVMQGSVHTDARASTAVLHAGQQAHLREGRLQARPDLGLASDGFADGVIQARAARLGDLVEELSRHQVGRVSCDASVALRRITGVFQLQDLTGTLRFIARTQSLTLHRRTPWWLHLAPATTA